MEREAKPSEANGPRHRDVPSASRLAISKTPFLTRRLPTCAGLPQIPKNPLKKPLIPNRQKPMLSAPLRTALVSGLLLLTACASTPPPALYEAAGKGNLQQV